jgi:uncharacterized protein (DUF362 family)
MGELLNSPDIVIHYGADPNEMVPAVLDRLRAADRIQKNKPVGIKPNLVVSKPSSSGATTDPRIVESIIVYLQSHGIGNIVVLESAWIGDDTERAFTVCGYRALQEKYDIRLLNVEKAKTVTQTYRDLSIQVNADALSLGYLINVPVLKAHSQTKVTCALKNMKGLIPAAEKRRFHDLGLDKPIAYLNKIIKPDLSLVDGIIGDLSFEEGGDPVRMNRIIAGFDSVRIDAFAAALLGYRLEDIGHIRLAAALGIGNPNLETATIKELNAPTPNTADTTAKNTAARYRKTIDEQRACSACLGSLIHALKRLEETKHISPSANRLCIGQGFKDIRGNGIGIGSCTRDFEKYVEGCPPSALKIRSFLETL